MRMCKQTKSALVAREASTCLSSRRRAPLPCAALACGRAARRRCRVAADVRNSALVCVVRARPCRRATRYRGRPRIPRAAGRHPPAGTRRPTPPSRPACPRRARALPRAGDALPTPAAGGRRAAARGRFFVRTHAPVTRASRSRGSAGCRAASRRRRSGRSAPRGRGATRRGATAPRSSSRPRSASAQRAAAAGGATSQCPPASRGQG